MWALNPCLGTLSQLAVRKASFPILVRQQIFTPQEMRILLPLLQAYPEYCEYDLLLASLNTLGPQTSEEQQGAWACERDTFDQMQPLRHAVSRARIKAHDIGLEIISLPEKGYALRHLDPEEEYRYV